MRNRIFKLLLVLVTILVIAGCAKNPSGNFGPSWDVAYQVPLVENEVETVEDLVGDNEDIQTDENTGVLGFNQLEELDPVKVGSNLTDVELPLITDTSNNQVIDLEPITVSGVDGPASQGTPIVGGLDDSLSDGDGTGPVSSDDITQLDSLSLDFGSAFETISFTADSGGMDVTVTNNSTDNITVESLELIFKEQGTTNEIGTAPLFTSLGQGASQTATWDLANTTLTNNDPGNNVDDIDLELKIKTDGALTDSGQIDISFAFQELEIASATGLNLDSVKETFERNISVDISESGLEEVGFSGGSLGVQIEETTDLDFDITSFSIGDLSANSGTIDLGGESLAFSSNANDGSSLDIGFSLDVSTSQTKIDYDSSKSITVKNGFDSAAEISSVTVDSSAFTFDDANQSFSEEIMSEVPEDISKLTLKDATAALKMEGYAIDNLELDLGAIDFKATYGDGTPSSTIGLDEINGGSAVINSSSNQIELLNDNTSADFLDWLQDLDNQENITSITLEGATAVNASNSVTIEAGDDFTPQVELDVPFNFELNEDLKEQMTPEPFEDTLSDSDVQTIEDNFKEGRLVIEEFNNSLPLDVDIKIYLGEVPDWDGIEDLGSYLDNLSQSEKDAELAKLYKDKNLFKAFNLEKQSGGEKKLLGLNSEDADRLTGDNLYMGYEIVIPGQDIKLESTDSIELENVYSILEVKVNQGGDQ